MRNGIKLNGNTDANLRVPSGTIVIFGQDERDTSLYLVCRDSHGYGSDDYTLIDLMDGEIIGGEGFDSNTKGRIEDFLRELVDNNGRVLKLIDADNAEIRTV